MIRAFSSLGCEALELSEVLELARAHGLRAVELRALGGSIDLAGYFGANFGAPDELAKVVQASGVAVVGLDASCRLMADDAEGEAELLALGPWAEGLGGVPMRVFDGGRVGDDAEFKLGVARWRWWERQRAQRGWRSSLLVETHDTLITGATVGRFLGQVDGEVSILWDAFHTWSKGDEHPVETWQAIRQAVAHIHVKDGVAGGGGGRRFTHTLPGAGDFPMAALRERLEADGYAGPLSLEWGRKWHPYLPPLADALGAAEAIGWW